MGWDDVLEKDSDWMDDLFVLVVKQGIVIGHFKGVFLCFGEDWVFAEDLLEIFGSFLIEVIWFLEVIAIKGDICNEAKPLNHTSQKAHDVLIREVHRHWDEGMSLRDKVLHFWLDWLSDLPSLLEAKTVEEIQLFDIKLHWHFGYAGDVELSCCRCTWSTI